MGAIMSLNPVAERTSWNDESRTLRHAWSLALLVHPPQHLGAVTPFVIQQVARGGYAQGGIWEAMAVRLHDAGFQPQEYVTLRDALRLRELIAQFGCHPAHQVKQGGDSGIYVWRIVPEEWHRWPVLYRCSRDAVRATRAVLVDREHELPAPDPKWSDEPERIHRDLRRCSFSSSDHGPIPSALAVAPRTVGELAAAVCQENSIWRSRLTQWVLAQLDADN